MKRKYWALMLGLAATAIPLAGHHSFAAEFDAKKVITLNGSVTRLEWANPHIWVYLDVKDADGSITHWQCEGGAPNALFRNGWNRNSLQAGQPVTIEGFLAKDGTHTCNAKVVQLPDGRKVFAGSSAPNAQ
jgi:hypothetical protein